MKVMTSFLCILVGNFTVVAPAQEPAGAIQLQVGSPQIALLPGMWRHERTERATLVVFQVGLLQSFASECHPEHPRYQRTQARHALRP